MPEQSPRMLDLWFYPADWKSWQRDAEIEGVTLTEWITTACNVLSVHSKRSVLQSTRRLWYQAWVMTWAAIGENFAHPPTFIRAAIALEISR